MQSGLFSVSQKNNHLFAYDIVIWCLFRGFWYQIVVVAFLVRLSSWYVGGWMCHDHEVLDAVLRCYVDIGM